LFDRKKQSLASVQCTATLLPHTSAKFSLYRLPVNHAIQHAL
jgi:hypothetical protein